MKYTKEERLEVGRKIYESGMSNLNAGHIFGISEESARRYRIMYEKSQGIEHETRKKQNNVIPSKALIDIENLPNNPEDYSLMTKEELIQELMKTKIREARLKKGYMVKGVGAEKEYILLDIKSIK